MIATGSLDCPRLPACPAHYLALLSDLGAARDAGEGSM
jgi:hypothetical protein